MIDVLVAGGGPAGLATAIEAARAGLEAVVVEPRPAPIDKACGEGIMPPGVRALERLGVALEGRPFVGIRYVHGDVVAEGRFAAPGLGVRRTTLHAALAARAKALGVRTIEGRVADVTQDESGVSAAGHRARWLVAADGLHSPIRRALGLDVKLAGPARYGVRRHFAVAPWTDHVEVHWADDAEAYVTPCTADLVGVAMLCRRGAARFDDLLARFPALRDRLPAPCTPALGAGPFGQRARRRVAGRVLLVGDAAGFLDPLTGEGVRLAVEAAREAIRAIRAGKPLLYDRAWRRLARRYWLFTSGLLAVARVPVLRRRIVPVLRAVPALFDAALATLAGE